MLEKRTKNVHAMVAMIGISWLVLAADASALDRAKPAPEKEKPTTTRDCARWRERVTVLDRDASSHREQIAQLAGTIAAGRQSIGERELELAEWLEAMALGRQLLSANACTIKLGCKTYTKVELACALKKIVVNYGVARCELDKLHANVAESEREFQEKTKRLAEILANRDVMAAKIERHEVRPASTEPEVTAIDAESVKVAKPVVSEPSRDETEVIAEVDRLIEAESSRKEMP